MYHPFALVRFDGSNSKTYLYGNKHRLSIEVGDRVRVKVAPANGQGRAQTREATIVQVGSSRRDLGGYTGPCRSLVEVVRMAPGTEHREPSAADPLRTCRCPVVTILGDPEMARWTCNGRRLRLQVGDHVVIDSRVGEVIAQVVDFADHPRDEREMLTPVIARAEINRNQGQSRLLPVVWFDSRRRTPVRQAVCAVDPALGVTVGRMVQVNYPGHGVLSGEVRNFRSVNATDAALRELPTIVAAAAPDGSQTRVAMEAVAVVAMNPRDLSRWGNLIRFGQFSRADLRVNQTALIRVSDGTVSGNINARIVDFQSIPVVDAQALQGTIIAIEAITETVRAPVRSNGRMWLPDQSSIAPARTVEPTKTKRRIDL